MGIEVFKKHLREKRAVKISLGFNQNTEKIATIAQCAQSAHASAIEIACNKDIYNVVKKNVRMPILASSIHPFMLQEALEWGVDGIEIREINPQKNVQNLDANILYEIALETLGLTNDYETFISVFIPKELKLEDKISLIKKLEVLGVDLINIESTISGNEYDEMFDIIKNSITPIIFTTKNEKTINEALKIGVCGVNIEINKDEIINQAQMQSKLLTYTGALAYRNSIYREIPKTLREFQTIKF